MSRRSILGELDARLRCGESNVASLFPFNCLMVLQENLKVETLQKQFEIVKQKTDKSHVQHFGNLSIALESVANFQGFTSKSARDGDRNYYSVYVCVFSYMLSEKFVRLESINRCMASARHSVVDIETR